jgi:capsular polysaccharide transport system ATP-binding protein
MIKVESLTKSYRLKGRRHFVFRDLSFEIPEKTNLGILGVNGAGKSTLLRILGGIDYPDSGRIQTHCTFSWPLGLSGGFIHHISARENCKMICRIYSMDIQGIPDALERIKSMSGIGNYFEDPMKTYSSGMKGRVAFALSMEFDFDYFLLDEITAVGDKLFRQTAANALEAKRQRSKVLMVSHQMNTLREFCDSGILLHAGKVSFFPDIDEAIETYDQVA